MGILIALALALGGLVPLAAAAELEEREAYVERAEPICKANVLANKRIFKGAESEVKKGELKKASNHFRRAAIAFSKTIRQLDAIPRPATDAAKLEKWTGVLAEVRDLIKKIGVALGAEKRNKAESYSVDLNRKSSQANNAVLLFGFDYCRIEPSRFKG